MFVAQFEGLLICAGAMIPSRPVLYRYAGKAGHGFFIVTWTVIGSVTVTPAMFVNTNVKSRAGRFGFTPRYESRFSFTAFASSGSPSWNLMPGRSVIVHCVKSALGVTDFARYGTYWPFALRTVSVS